VIKNAICAEHTHPASECPITMPGGKDMLKLERYGREVKQDTEGFDVIDTDASDTQANAPERSC
jgi:hypothetical protein